jgi:UDP-N-acetylmuramate dehydrogenase
MGLLKHSLIDRLPSVRGTYREKANLSKTTWFGVGGDAEVLFRPFDLQDLSYFIKNKPTSIPVTILGVGSNLLVRDNGIEGVVIKLGKEFTSFEILENNKVAIGAAYLNYNVANLTKNYELSGLEFLVGIPGSIGGSLAMNAGAYGKEISGVLEIAEVIDPEGNIHHLSPREINFFYRGNSLPEGWIFTKGIFNLTKGDKEQIEETLQDIIEKRLASQPIKTKTSGSTFMNPVGKKAWQLIDEAGCRGLKRGGAEVSEMHCNFLINNGNATAKDLEELGEIVRQKVFEKSGIKLEWEIKRVGKS